jgi:uncharacterized coiled-coil DUF342 family protein
VVKKLCFVLSMLVLNTHVYASAPMIEKPKHSEIYLDEKIKEFDAKLSEYLHVPIKKFSSILNEIADYIYLEEFTPLHQEINHLQRELAQLKRDLKDTNIKVQTLTKQVEDLQRTK